MVLDQREKEQLEMRGEKGVRKREQRGRKHERKERRRRGVGKERDKRGVGTKKEGGE